jgi:hypothetical protein
VVDWNDFVPDARQTYLPGQTRHAVLNLTDVLPTTYADIIYYSAKVVFLESCQYQLNQCPHLIYVNY